MVVRASCTWALVVATKMTWGKGGNEVSIGGRVVAIHLLHMFVGI